MQSKEIELRKAGLPRGFSKVKRRHSWFSGLSKLLVSGKTAGTPELSVLGSQRRLPCPKGDTDEMLK